MSHANDHQRKNGRNRQNTKKESTTTETVNEFRICNDSQTISARMVSVCVPSVLTRRCSVPTFRYLQLNFKWVYSSVSWAHHLCDCLRSTFAICDGEKSHIYVLMSLTKSGSRCMPRMMRTSHEVANPIFHYFAPANDFPFAFNPVQLIIFDHLPRCQIIRAYTSWK